MIMGEAVGSNIKIEVQWLVWEEVPIWKQAFETCKIRKRAKSIKGEKQYRNHPLGKKLVAYCGVEKEPSWVMSHKVSRII